jgi:hypothetical protein
MESGELKVESGSLKYEQVLFWGSIQGVNCEWSMVNRSLKFVVRSVLRGCLGEL